MHIKTIFGYRTSVHASTGVAPFTAMFRRNPVLPIYLETGPQAKDAATTEETIKELTERVVSEKKAAEEKMAMNIAKSQIRQKRNYGKRHTGLSSEIVEG